MTRIVMPGDVTPDLQAQTDSILNAVNPKFAELLAKATTEHSATQSLLNALQTLVQTNGTNSAQYKTDVLNAIAALTITADVNAHTTSEKVALNAALTTLINDAKQAILDSQKTLVLTRPLSATATVLRGENKTMIQLTGAGVISQLSLGSKYSLIMTVDGESAFDIHSNSSETVIGTGGYVEKLKFNTSLRVEVRGWDHTSGNAALKGAAGVWK